MKRTRATAGRPPSVNPRRDGIFARVTPDELAAIDEARALAPVMTRAAFVRQGAVMLAQTRLLKKGR